MRDKGGFCPGGTLQWMSRKYRNRAVRSLFLKQTRKKSGKTENLPSRTVPRSLCEGASLPYRVLSYRKVIVCIGGKKHKDAYSERNCGNMEHTDLLGTSVWERDVQQSLGAGRMFFTFYARTQEGWLLLLGLVNGSKDLGESDKCNHSNADHTRLFWASAGNVGCDTSVFGARRSVFTFPCARRPRRLLLLRLLEDFENLDGSTKNNPSDLKHASLLVT